jgi:hypothetical protein
VAVFMLYFAFAFLKPQCSTAWFITENRYALAVYILNDLCWHEQIIVFTCTVFALAVVCT